MLLLGWTRSKYRRIFESASNTILENKVRIDGWLDCSGITSDLSIYTKEYLNVDKDINLKGDLIVKGNIINEVEDNKQIYKCKRK